MYGIRTVIVQTACGFSIWIISSKQGRVLTRDVLGWLVGVAATISSNKRSSLRSSMTDCWLRGGGRVPYRRRMPGNRKYDDRLDGPHKSSRADRRPGSRSSPVIGDADSRPCRRSLIDGSSLALSSVISIDSITARWFYKIRYKLCEEMYSSLTMHFAKL